MAAVMTCPAHGPVDDDYCSVAGCFEPLHPFAPSVKNPVGECAAVGCGMALPCPLHGGGPADAGVREVAIHLAAALASATDARPVGPVTAASLLFPWGTVGIPATGLMIGRDHGSHCGEQIETFDNVSRSHARVYLDGGRLLVVDLDSTNGTTVNGVRVVPEEPTSLADGDVLGCGNRLCCTVFAKAANA